MQLTPDSLHANMGPEDPLRKLIERKSKIKLDREHGQVTTEDGYTFGIGDSVRFKQVENDPHNTTTEFKITEIDIPESQDYDKTTVTLSNGMKIHPGNLEPAPTKA